jgi:hypothetical protein
MAARVVKKDDLFERAAKASEEDREDRVCSDVQKGSTKENWN